MSKIKFWLEGMAREEHHPPKEPHGLYKAGRSMAIKKVKFPQHEDTGLLGEYRGRLLEWRAALVRDLQNEFYVLEKKINELAISCRKEQFIDKLGDPIHGLEVNCNKSYNDADVQGALAEFSEERDSLRVFAMEHDRIEDPKNAHKSGGIYWWVLGGLIVVESVLNGFLFVQPLGLIRGLGVSIPAACINVITGYLIGRFVIGAILYHREKAWRLLSFATAIFYAVVVVYLNFALGVFRSMASMLRRQVSLGGDTVDSASSTSDTVGGGLSENTVDFGALLLERAVDALRPFSHLNELDIMSAIFIAVGIVIFSIAALIDGWVSDDPYPGYGAAWRKCSNAREKLKDIIDTLRQDTHDSCNQAELEQKQQYESLKEDISQWSDHVNRLQKRFQDYEDWTSDAEKSWSTANLKFNDGYREYRGKSGEATDVDVTALFADDERNPQHVFRDIGSYLGDKERTQRANQYQMELDDAYAKEQQALRSMEKSMRDRVDSVKIMSVKIGNGGETE